MTTLSGDEPDLELGASGEHVVQLQDRLRGVGLLDKFPDGTYDDQTETAVRQLQNSLGQTGDGKVTQETWQALDQHMLEQGLQYNPYAGPGQQHWDLAEQPVAQEAARAAQPEPYWDGEKWLQWDAQAGQWLPMQDTAPSTEPEPAAIPHIDDIHPAIRDDERFSSFHDFLRERHGS